MAKVSNEELVRKAVVTADAIALAGRLNPQQAEKFIDYVVDLSGLKNNARIVRIKTDWEIDKIGVGKRVAMPKTEAVAPSGRRGVTTSKVTLTPKTIVVPFEIGDEFREENIEGDDVEDTIIRMMAAQLANDMEELYVNGDTLGRASLQGDIIDGGSATQYVLDTYLQLFDGWLKKARSGNVYNAAGANIGPSTVSGMIRAMPQKFRRDYSKLRMLLAPDLEQLFRERTASRATAAGDAALSSRSPLTPYGLEMAPFPLWPFNPKITEHLVLPTTTAVSCLFAPIVSASEVVFDMTGDTLTGDTPRTPLVEGTDYDMDYTNGTIARNAGGSLGDGDTVKITYSAQPQVVLTHFMNLIVGIGREIRIEKDRDIFKGVNQYAITTKIACDFEELTALVFGKNFGETAV